MEAKALTRAAFRWVRVLLLYPYKRKSHPDWDDFSMVDDNGLDLHFYPAGIKIMERLGQALAGGAHPRRI